MKRMSHAARDLLRRKTIYENAQNKYNRNAVFDYPANAQINIERFEHKIEEVKTESGYTEEQRAEKIAWCQSKIADIKQSVQRFYEQHPWIQK
ncbi:MAG: hypothetical protein IKZ49_04460 [Alphaproteobacteria bacterium]|nr:hypothetical protein [Alphaproteobacteria bacterium]